jgi:hypothetical protein
VPEYRDFNYFQYMRPDRRHEELQAFASRVFTGEIRNRWIDRQNENIFSKYRLIKEIRANLLLKWLHVQFPHVRSVFLMRHPCAVVLSRMQLGWDTDRDIQPFLSQADLVADHIRDHVDFIRSLKTDEEKHAVIWSVSNFVPLQQFKPGELNIVYYENLCIRPDTEIQMIFQSLGLGFDHPAAGNADHPSQTTRAQSAVVTGSDKVSHWRNILRPGQIDRILNVVKAFGLDHLYDDSPLPLNPQSKSDVAAKAGL